MRGVAGCRTIRCVMPNGNRERPEKRHQQHRGSAWVYNSNRRHLHPGHEIESGLRAEWGGTRPPHWNKLSGRMLPGEKEISERFNKKTEWRENHDETHYWKRYLPTT